MNEEKLLDFLLKRLTQLVAETNGISLYDTLDLLLREGIDHEHPAAHRLVADFLRLIEDYHIDRARIQDLLQHPVSLVWENFFKMFPLKYQEEHIHLTGSLTASFIYPRLMKILQQGPHNLYEKKIKEVYGAEAWPIESEEQVDRLIRLGDQQGFHEYLRILYLPKLILLNREAHQESAYHMAHELYYKFNIGQIRLKFSVSRVSVVSQEQIPGADLVQVEDVILGLYEGFREFQKGHPDFRFILSPSFRKESGFFDSQRFRSRQEHFEYLVDQIVRLIDTYPDLREVLCDVDTVGDELDLYRKGHFNEFKKGFRRLQYRGLHIRSHHGETFRTLRRGIQAVDNAMNIWHIDTLEHGLSLGINPNYYFHRIYQKAIGLNREKQRISTKDSIYNELAELEWSENGGNILEKLISGIKLNRDEELAFLKAKFHTAREVEHYQHDVLNRMIQKGVNLIVLPSSNNKLTGQLEDYKDHPFSWWEKKGVKLGLGTDNYVTLNTNYIREMLILLYSDPKDLKIMKLLMVTTGENRRPFLSQLLWRMHKQFPENL